ncbi:hypothetical protein ALC56_09065 [Trachymyrmex septentrionalis]|uniref:Uncharacterized protein n=1 Tax=Trachymyrmex septentrionalis TaxID=34720 RepID=A0A151JUR6_9HYME|nr:hypothetical protein ALC56_09065 [Trachymyrmex septentrionalis]
MINSEKTRFSLRVSVFCLLLSHVSHSWNLTSLNISDNVLIWRFAVWKNRAFLAIPRLTNEKQEEWKPTLVEVSWPEINLSLNIANAVISSKLFPKSRASKRDYETLVSVTGLDVDARGRLWVLDAPDGYDRWPRIIIYDLKRNDRLVSSTELTKVSVKHLKSLVVDPFEDQWGFRGYIADAGDETIIIYSSGNLETQNVTVTWLGKKLGSSIGLFCDLKDGLHYFMTSERASVRWNTKLPLNAQSHSVLVQNDDVPCITDYIMDARRNVWGLVNSKCPGATKKNTLSNSTLKSRTIKIQKYYFAMQ